MLSDPEKRHKKISHLVVGAQISADICDVFFLGTQWVAAARKTGRPPCSHCHHWPVQYVCPIMVFNTVQ